MCGIAGVFSRKNEGVFPEIADMLSMMRHRGPEGFGISTPEGVKKHETFKQLNSDVLPGNPGIGHCLLSITQPFGKRLAKTAGAWSGLQPFQSTEKKLSIAHNGQIYNYAELTNRKVQSDSEAILHFFEKYDAIETGISDFMQAAIGKYAVAINSGNSIYAFRDVLGIKPIWYGGNEEYYAFASEPVALKKINIQFPQPLLPGHVLKISEKGIETKKIYGDYRRPMGR